MADTVNIPGIKKPLPKVGVAIGLGGVGVAIFLYYRNKKSAAATTSAAAAATTTDQYPPDGTVGNPSDPYSTDPATGQTYGDEAAGAGTYGAYGYQGGGTGDGSGGGGSGGGTGGPPFATNDAWANWVIQQEQSINPSVNIAAFQNAIGLYLQGQPVDPTQRQYIFDALAIGGDPPVSGTNGYPPKVQGSGGGGGGNAHNPVTNLQASPTSNGADLTWDASAGATSYEVDTTAGSTSFSKHKVTDNKITLVNMKAGTSYTTSVLANPATAGAKAATVTYTPSGSGGGGGGGGGGGESVHPPDNIRITGKGHTVTAVWDPSPGATKYLVVLSNFAVEHNMPFEFARKTVTSSQVSFSGVPGPDIPNPYDPNDGRSYYLYMWAYPNGPAMPGNALGSELKNIPSWAWTQAGPFVVTPRGSVVALNPYRYTGPGSGY